VWSVPGSAPTASGLFASLTSCFASATPIASTGRAASSRCTRSVSASASARISLRASAAKPNRSLDAVRAAAIVRRSRLAMPRRTRRLHNWAARRPSAGSERGSMPAASRWSRARRRARTHMRAEHGTLDRKGTGTLQRSGKRLPTSLPGAPPRSLREHAVTMDPGDRRAAVARRDRQRPTGPAAFRARAANHGRVVLAGDPDARSWLRPWYKATGTLEKGGMRCRTSL
jgi:hypothetical protein